MGFQTTVILHNDFIHELLTDRRLGDKLADCMARAQANRDGSDSASTTGIVAYNSHHMDDIRLYLIGHGRLFSAYDDMPEDIRHVFIERLRSSADKLGFKLIKKPAAKPPKPNNLDSWKKEFYPSEAHTTLIKDAVRHSLTKWTGLRKENLDKHNVHIRADGVRDKTTGDILKIDSESCALCVHYFTDDGNNSRCYQCPLAIARDGVCCDHEMEGELRSPYRDFTVNGDPEPMIQWLKAIPV